MAKSSAGSGFRCTECGWQSPKWTGRCGRCQAWGTVQEAVLPRLARGARLGATGGIRSAVRSVVPASTTPIPIGQVDATDATARPSGMDELDRVLGGGLVPGAVLLLAGEPGVGKSMVSYSGSTEKRLGPGSYSEIPANTPHSAKCASGAECVFALMSSGRFEIKPVPEN